MNRFNKTSLTVAIAALTSFNANAGQTPDKCYDFSNMSENASYTVGDVIETDFATINIKEYTVNGAPVEASNRRAEAIRADMAGGASPELNLYVVALNVVPKKPVSKITTQIAQSIAANGNYADAGIGVNKRGYKSLTGFSDMNGKVLGTAAKGKAKISTNILPVGNGGNWHRGTLEFRAVQGSIESIRLGGHAWRIDNMCFTY